MGRLKPVQIVSGVRTEMASGVAEQHKFETLDALRGIAALVVVIYHTGDFVRGQRPLGHAYLAVDLFFMLSGFVLSFAYQSKLDAGQSTLSFLKIRLIRLYPLYLLGVAISFLHFLDVQFSGMRHSVAAPVSVSTSLLLFVLAVFFIPALPDATPGRAAFPFNAPAWSLFFELVANIGHALFLRRRSVKVLGAIVGVCGVALVWNVAQMGSTNHGVSLDNVVFGLLRVIFSYVLGMVVYRLHQKGFRGARVSALIPCLLLCAVLSIPNRAGGAVYDCAMLVLVLPGILVLGVSATPLPGGVRGVFNLLGTLSYAIYILHLPVMSFFERHWQAMARGRVALSSVTAAVSFVVFVLIFSFLTDWLYDFPVRRFLRRKLGRPQCGVDPGVARTSA